MRRLVSLYMALAIASALLWVSPAAAQQGTNGLGFYLIGAMTANNSASLQFTSPWWSTNYNTLFLNCQGLLASVATTKLVLEVGEGSPVTWKTTAHYTYSSGQGGGTNGTDIIVDYMAGMATSGTPTYLQAFIDNPASSSVVKMVTVWLGGGQNGGGGWDLSSEGDTNNQNLNLSGYWNSDTNPLTGIELLPTGGTIASGTCSLYGMQ